MRTQREPARLEPARFEILSMAREFGELEPHERVLDIGCGNGRWAAALTGYLTEKGRYDGVDIVPDRITRCKERVGDEYPNFRFQLIDAYNKHYNPQGSIQAQDLRFPFEDEQFDLVVLYSIFTHMLPEDVDQYFSEISRVLRSGGRMLASCFLLNLKSLEQLERREGGLQFDHDFGVYRAMDLDVPEAIIAYSEEYLRDLYTKFGLRFKRPIAYGDWPTQEKRPWHQDLIVAEKT